MKENLKVTSFHPGAKNALLFVLLSLFFVVLQRSLQSSLPFMNWVFLQTTLLAEWPLLFLALPTSLMLLKHRHYARYALAIFCGWVIFRSLEGLFLNFNKVLMVMLFIYVCMSYTFYQLLSWIFSRAIFSPNFTRQDLRPPMAHRINVQISLRGQNYAGYLTNWDPEGAFIYLAEPWTRELGELELSVLLEGKEFAAVGRLATMTWDARGIGVEWNKAVIPGKLPWNSLVELFQELGWQPELLR